MRPSSAPPETSPLQHVRSGLDACVHCGFCLQSCPTYLALDDENDSPRGRILLMRALASDALPADDPALRLHIDRCLGCRACETACPSGVPYGELLEATRATLTRTVPLSAAARVLLGAFRHAWLRAPFLAAGRLVRDAGIARLLGRMPGRIPYGFAMAMLAGSTPARRFSRYHPRGTGERGRVGLLSGCVMAGLFRHTNLATRRTLVVNDYAVVTPPRQSCCGALHAHAGDLDGARVLARRNIAAFERAGCDFIAVNSAGCGAAMKEYGRLLADDPAWAARAASIAGRVRDVTELLADAGPRPGAPISGAEILTVAYSPPCHLQHAQRVTAAPLKVLRAVPGLELRALPREEQCCGSAGIYNLVQPEISAAVLSAKLGDIERSRARLVATGNPGCLMQIGAGLVRARRQTRVIHPVDLLDESYAARQARA